MREINLTIENSGFLFWNQQLFQYTEDNGKHHLSPFIKVDLTVFWKHDGEYTYCEQTANTTIEIVLASALVLRTARNAAE